MEPILSVEHLSVTFTRYGRGLNRVELNPIRNLSLAVEPGRVTAVVGESGQRWPTPSSTCCPETPGWGGPSAMTATPSPKSGRQPFGAGRLP